MADAHQFCTFHVDGLYFGVEVLQVQEIIRYHEMTNVPLANEVISGLINLRGQVVTAIDLRRRLELPDRPAETLPMNVVVRTSEGVISMLVDEIGDVLDVDPSTHERTPETLSGVTRELVSGIYKLKDRLLLILDIEKAVNLTGAAV